MGSCGRARATIIKKNAAALKYTIHPVILVFRDTGSPLSRLPLEYLKDDLLLLSKYNDRKIISGRKIRKTK
jgi:hypothetical protein